MSERILLLTEGKIGLLVNNAIQYLMSQPLNTYRKNLSEIRKRNEWKTSGVGAMFMHGQHEEGADEPSALTGTVNGIAQLTAKTVIYTLNVGDNTGIHCKNISDESELESYILRSNAMRIFELDYDRVTGRIIASASESGIEKHLALFHEQTTDCRFITEGDSIDQNPVWSRQQRDVIYYDSCGIAVDEAGICRGVGPRSIYSLNLISGELNEVIADNGFDYIKPYEDATGNLYYIKRPYTTKQSTNRMTLKEILLMPVKLLNAVFGWLNFFTQRYSGQSLKTAGSNPAKTKPKSAEEIYIEGNLVNVLQTQRDNEKRGEQHPGVAPRSWQLMKRDIDGREVVLKQGVLAFAVCSSGDIIYSNGSYILKQNHTDEIMLAKVGVVTKILPVDESLLNICGLEA